MQLKVSHKSLLEFFDSCELRKVKIVWKVLNGKNIDLFLIIVCQKNGSMYQINELELKDTFFLVTRMDNVVSYNTYTCVIQSLITLNMRLL